MLQRKLAPYPRDSVRYVPTIEEELGAVEALTADKLKDLYSKQVGGTDGEAALVGDFDPTEATSQLKELLGGWKAEVPYKRIERPAALDVAGGKEVIRTPDKANAFYIGGLNDAVSDSDPEYASLEVGNFLLGAAPLASRLSNRVRGKEGLSYTVRSDISASTKDKNGRFRMYAICNPVNMPKVETAMREELEKFLKEGPSAGELAEAKAAYLKKLRVERASDANLAALLASNLYAGRTFQYQADLEKRIAELTPDQVKEAFRKAVPVDRLVIVEAGDFKSE
jgi:zinc protease